MHVVASMKDGEEVYYLSLDNHKRVAECWDKEWAHAIANACTIVAGIGKAALEQKCPAD